MKKLLAILILILCITSLKADSHELEQIEYKGNTFCQFKIKKGNGELRQTVQIHRDSMRWYVYSKNWHQFNLAEDRQVFIKCKSKWHFIFDYESKLKDDGSRSVKDKGVILNNMYYLIDNKQLERLKNCEDLSLIMKGKERKIENTDCLRELN